MSTLGTPLLLLALLGAEPAKLPVDKDGYTDYEKALNEQLSKGITPERNANVLLWKAYGPTPDYPNFDDWNNWKPMRMPAEYFKWLGIPEPPKEGNYFISLAVYAWDRLKFDKEARKALLAQQKGASERPWKTTDYPQIAKWLEANEKPLVVVVEATKRPDYFYPHVIGKKDKKELLFSVLLRGAWKSRELASALTVRAMLRVGEGKLDAAWQDILACHRLGRLVGRGGELREGIFGYMIDRMATKASLAFLERTDLTSIQLGDRLKDLQNLPPFSSLAAKIDLAQRYFFLDFLDSIRRGGMEDDSTLEEKNAWASLNWDPAIASGNMWFDRMTAATRLKTRPERQKELKKIEEEFKDMQKSMGEELEAIQTNPGPVERTFDQVTVKTLGNTMIGMAMPSGSRLQNATDRAEQIQRNLHLAFALAAYRKDEGKYPAKLDALSPKFLAVIPDDVFSGKAMIYRPEGEGYLLYSVGVNGKDDGGRMLDDDPPGDDIGVRMPLPERKQTK